MLDFAFSDIKACQRVIGTLQFANSSEASSVVHKEKHRISRSRSRTMRTHASTPASLLSPSNRAFKSRRPPLPTTQQHQHQGAQLLDLSALVWKILNLTMFFIQHIVLACKEEMGRELCRSPGADHVWPQGAVRLCWPCAWYIATQVCAHTCMHMHLNTHCRTSYIDTVCAMQCVVLQYAWTCVCTLCVRGFNKC